MKVSLEVISIRLTPDWHELVVRGDIPDGKFDAELDFTNAIDLTQHGRLIQLRFEISEP